MHLEVHFSLGDNFQFLILREETKLRVFENMVLRRIFGPRRKEATGEWRRLNNVELHITQYFAGDKM